MLTDLEADSYTIRDYLSNSVVYSGEVKEAKHWSMSGELVQMIDFSAFETPGHYYVQIGNSRSYPFEIKDDDLYDSLSVWTLKAFYLWRCSSPIEKKYSTFKNISFEREIGHTDSVVYMHLSAASEYRHVESEHIASKGWYDAGDYNKYIVNAGFSTQFFNFAYELNPQYYNNLDLNIPESHNEIPDILDELKWELDWMMSMQDPNDGGVYFKLSSLKFPKLVMPNKDKEDRYLIGKSTSSALNFAATMAMAARLYSKYDSIFDGFSEKALKAAERAYEWAQANPNIVFRNPSDVTTGEYFDDCFDDEFFLANVYLYLATKNEDYYSKLKLNQLYDTPTWNNQYSMGLLELYINRDMLPTMVDRGKVEIKFKALADNIYKQYFYSVGKIPLKKFEWGSNGVVATNGSILGIAYHYFKDEKYLTASAACFDYLLGRNSVDYSFVSMFGSHYPKHLNDRRSQCDDNYEPLPGYLCGGPNKDDLTDCGQSNYPSSIYPARSYLDEECSFSTNEIAINWNAPLVLLTGLMINNNQIK